MSARQRSEAFKRAVRKGSDAFWRGESIDSNPYKKSEWGNGGAWDMGYRRAMQAKEQGLMDSLNR